MTLQSVGICVSEYRFMQLLLFLTRPTVCVTGAGAGVDSAWEQEKLEARKMLENGDESHLSSARFVSPLLHFYNDPIADHWESVGTSIIQSVVPDESSGSPRYDSKAIFLPSGDQDGAPSYPSYCVILRALPSDTDVMNKLANSSPN
jgi:hypothetical protein